MKAYEGINPFVNLITGIWCPPGTLLDPEDTLEHKQIRFISLGIYIPLDKRDDKQKIK